MALTADRLPGKLLVLMPGCRLPHNFHDELLEQGRILGADGAYPDAFQIIGMQEQ